MAAGKPIVASRIGQIAEILRDEKTALLIPPGDTISLARAIARLRADPDLRRRLGQAARVEAEMHHTWESRINFISGLMAEMKIEAMR
jgi:glycosyltransferase involved in cell wall biosynthesis